jgi:hypothetical protein
MDTMQSHLHVELKKFDLIEARVEKWLPEAEGEGNG